jgi:hypothetical protein
MAGWWRGGELGALTKAGLASELLPWSKGFISATSSPQPQCGTTIANKILGTFSTSENTIWVVDSRSYNSIGLKKALLLYDTCPPLEYDRPRPRFGHAWPT